MNGTRPVLAALFALVAFWLGAQAFVRGDGVPDWWLPVALLLGAGAAFAVRTHADATQPPARWPHLAPLLLLVTAIAIALFVGATATPSRHWDGATAFDPKVFWLSQTPTLQQPYFTGEGVFHHSPDYQLLLSLLVACTDRLVPGCGRAVLPMLYLLLLGVTWTALRLRAVRPVLCVLGTAAVAVTPALLNTSGGAVDSGYHDVLLLTTTTCVAAGLLNAHALLLGLGVFLTIVAKPEGVAYVAAAMAVLFARGERRLLWTTALATGAAMISWAPVRAVLLHRDGGYGVLWVVLAGLGALLLLQVTTDRLSLQQRGRWIVVLALPTLALLLLPWFAPLFVGDDSAIGVYMRQAARAHEGLANLPAYLGGAFHYGVARLRFGATFVLPVALVVIARIRRLTLPDHRVAAFALLGLVTTAVPFVLSPEPDLDHHLRSSMTRLLIHWVGPVWLLSIAWLDALLGPTADERDRYAPELTS